MQQPGPSAGRLMAGPVRLAPDGVWRAAVSPRRWWALTPPFHPYHRRLRRVIRRWRSPFCATFRRLSPPGISPASCPTVSGLSSSAHSSRGSRSPGLHRQLYPWARDFGSRRAQRRPAFGTLEPAEHLHDELAADEALEARAARERGQLLIERAEQGRDLAHDTILKTPTTLPSTCTYDGYMGSSASFSGWSRIRPFSR